MARDLPQLLSDYCHAFSEFDIGAIKEFYERDALLRFHTIENGSASTSSLHTGGIFKSLWKGKIPFEFAFWKIIRELKARNYDYAAADLLEVYEPKEDGRQAGTGSAHILVDYRRINKAGDVYAQFGVVYRCVKPEGEWLLAEMWQFEKASDPPPAICAIFDSIR